MQKKIIKILHHLQTRVRKMPIQVLLVVGTMIIVISINLIFIRDTTILFFTLTMALGIFTIIFEEDFDTEQTTRRIAENLETLDSIEEMEIEPDEPILE